MPDQNPVRGSGYRRFYQLQNKESHKSKPLPSTQKGARDSGENVLQPPAPDDVSSVRVEPVLSVAVRCYDKHRYRKHHGEERVYVLTLPNPSPSPKEGGAELKQELQIPAEEPCFLACSLPQIS